MSNPGNAVIILLVVAIIIVIITAILVIKFTKRVNLVPPVGDSYTINSPLDPFPESIYQGQAYILDAASPVILNQTGGSTMNIYSLAASPVTIIPDNILASQDDMSLFTANLGDGSITITGDNIYCKANGCGIFNDHRLSSRYNDASYCVGAIFKTLTISSGGASRLAKCGRRSTTMWSNSRENNEILFSGQPHTIDLIW